MSEAGYKPLPSGIVVRDSEIHGQGLFAAEPLEHGTHLGATHWCVAGVIIRTPLGGLGNHSLTPNCYKIQDGEASYLCVGVNDIAAGEEITWTYTLYDPAENKPVEAEPMYDPKAPG